MSSLTWMPARKRLIMCTISSQMSSISGEPYSPLARVPRHWVRVKPDWALANMPIIAWAEASASGSLASTPPPSPKVGRL